MAESRSGNDLETDVIGHGFAFGLENRVTNRHIQPDKKTRYPRASREPRPDCDERRMSMFFLILAIILLALWLFGWLAFHFVTGAFHLLVVLALIFIILHFVRGRRVRV